MEKGKIILKLNIKDYSKSLEELLSQKPFSENTKNLLLSMLYKIENSYLDYKKVKIDVPSKNDILDELMILVNNCEDIEILIPKKLNEDLKKATIIKNEKKIIVYPNEIAMLYALYRLGEDKYRIKDNYPLLASPLNRLLNIGYAMDRSEIIRDFDGWSWRVNISNIENIFANFLYQSLKIVVNIDDIDDEDIIIYIKDKLQILNKKAKTLEFLRTFFTLTIIYNLEEYENENQRIKEYENSKIKELKILSNRTKYLENLTKEKIKIEHDLANINKLLNNDKLLQQEYIKTNQKLPQTNKIFCLSDFSEIQEQEKLNLIAKLEIINKKQEPKNYMQNKSKIEEELKFLEGISTKATNKSIIIVEFIKNIVKTLENKLKISETKKQIVDLLYKIRYYKKIPVDEKTTVENIVETKKSLEKLEKDIITKACNLKIINIISKDVLENYRIATEIINMGIIDLESIYLECKQKGTNVDFNIYEEKSFEKTLNFSGIVDLNIKQNKKIKLFI